MNRKIIFNNPNTTSFKNGISCDLFAERGVGAALNASRVVLRGNDRFGKRVDQRQQSLGHSMNTASCVEHRSGNTMSE